MPFKHLVVIGTSAGGIDALRVILGALPADFAAPVCIVMHISPDSPGLLPEILGRAGPLPAVSPRNGEQMRPGVIYVAPPDRHVVVEPGILRVTKGPKENRFRPAIDPLFRSAAQVYGPAAIGVILTGSLDDGSAGLRAIKQLGGIAIVQDPADALFPSMPASAMASVRIDHAVPVAELAHLLVQLTAGPPPAAESDPPPEHLRVEVDIAKETSGVDAGLMSVARPSSYACPECHGVLLQLDEAGCVRFRCHTGHAYSLESLLASINDGIEASLWGAIRALEEEGMLLEELRQQVSSPHDASNRSSLAERARTTRAHADVLRRLVMHRHEK